MNTPIEVLTRDSLIEGGFAGLKEHQLVKAPSVFGPQETDDGSWPGLGNFVYLADARFMPHGETLMHGHHEIDVISVMVKGRISHQGSLASGQNLIANDIQVQRAGGEGFSHNEINPDDEWNQMIQIWVLPEISGQAAAYKVYQPAIGELTRIYGGDNNSNTDFPAKTQIDIAILNTGQHIEVNAPFMAYLSQGKGVANNTLVKAGDLLRGKSIQFIAQQDVQLIIIHL